MIAYPIIPHSVKGMFNGDAEGLLTKTPLNLRRPLDAGGVAMQIC